MKNLKQKLKNAGIGALTILFLTGCGYERQIKEYSKNAEKALAKGDTLKAGSHVASAIDLAYNSDRKDLYDKYLSSIVPKLKSDGDRSFRTNARVVDRKGNIISHGGYTNPYID